MTHIAERTCICCRKKFNKCDLIRIAKINGEFILDKTGKADGRGAYICKDVECAKKLVKNKVLNKVFKCIVPDSIYSDIVEYSEGNSDK